MQIMNYFLNVNNDIAIYYQYCLPGDISLCFPPRYPVMPRD